MDNKSIIFLANDNISKTNFDKRHKNLIFAIFTLNTKIDDIFQKKLS